MTFKFFTIFIAFAFLLAVSRCDNENDAGGSPEVDTNFDFVQGDSSRIPPRPKSPGEDGPGGGMKLSMPKLSEEEQHSTNLPSHLKCDACQAIVFQIQKRLAERESKQLKRERGKPLRESQYLEVFEDLCNSDWEGYGLKEIDGVTTLSGPGLPAESHMSMMSGGGMWPRRLNKKCGQIVESIGEDELYEMYVEMKEKPSGMRPELFCKTVVTDCKKPTKKPVTSGKKKKSAKMNNGEPAKDEL